MFNCNKYNHGNMPSLNSHNLSYITHLTRDAHSAKLCGENLNWYISKNNDLIHGSSCCDRYCRFLLSLRFLLWSWYIFIINLSEDKMLIIFYINLAKFKVSWFLRKQDLVFYDGNNSYESSFIYCANFILDRVHVNKYGDNLGSGTDIYTSIHTCL